MPIDVTMVEREIDEDLYDAVARVAAALGVSVDAAAVFLVRLAMEDLARVALN
jgi:hypothetical protein